MRASAGERGLTILEALLVITILAIALVPLIDLAVSSRRVSHSAGRFIEVSLHGHGIADALARLSVADLPTLPATGQVIVLADSTPPAGASGRFGEVAAHFAKPPPLPMDRTAFAEKLPTGEVLVTLKIIWTAVEGEQKTEREIVIPVLVTPPGWE